MPDTPPATIDGDLLRLVAMGSGGGQTLNLDAIRQNAVAPPPMDDTSAALAKLNEIIKSTQTTRPDTSEAQKKYADDLLASMQGPSKEEQLARLAQARADALLNQTKVALAPPTRYGQPDIPGLTLPQAPQSQQAQVNPIAQAAAAIAGLFHPQAAGEFGAAALGGALKATQERNRLQQQQYQNEFERTVQQHRAAVEQADAKLRVNIANTDLQNRFTEEQNHQKMADAKTASEAAELGAVAKVNTDLEAKAKPAREAAARADAEGQALTRQEQQFEADRKLGMEASSTLAKLEELKQAAKDKAKAASELEASREQARKDLQKDAIASRERISAANRQAANSRAAESAAIRREGNRIRRELGAGGAAGKMVHPSPATKAAEREMMINGTLYSKAEADYQKSPSPESKAAAESALKAWRESSSRYVQAGETDKAAYRGGPASVTPPPGARIKTFNPATGRVE